MSVIAQREIKHNGVLYQKDELIEDISDKDEERLVSKGAARYLNEDDEFENFEENPAELGPEEITEELLTEKYPEIIAKIKEDAKNEGIEEEKGRNVPVTLDSTIIDYSVMEYADLVNLVKEKGITTESKGKEVLIAALEAYEDAKELIFQKIDKLTLAELNELFPADNQPGDNQDNQ